MNEKISDEVWVKKLKAERQPLGPPPERYVRKGHKSDVRL